ncbi:hypothetical protein [Parasitella parasitica]|uniref:Mediator of RNA polymerase II transcription subunit 5 n=1 Tax=Parasitella parasitica TaxID=35722 RepID=A0A0B7N5K8_9FUNG|nr:hypothetical protein [Parasitella parasitica]
MLSKSYSLLLDTLLTTLFSFTRVSDPLIESYLTFATTGKTTTTLDSDPASSNSSSSIDDPIVSPITFISKIVPFAESTASRNPYQWQFLLKLLPHLLVFNTDDLVSDLVQKGKDNPWVDVLASVFQLLSHIVAVGLYPNWYARPIAQTPLTITSALSFHNNNSGNNTQPFDSQFSFQSQQSMNFDGDATLDIDNTQQIDEDQPLGGDVKDTQMSDPVNIEKNPGEKKSIEIDNAALAAQIMIHLIEKRDAKRIFQARNNQRRQAGGATAAAEAAAALAYHANHIDDDEPWVQCLGKLESKHYDTAMSSLPLPSPSPVASQNSHIQKLLLLMQRLTDRDLERRMAVHMKYHELEDEGTARAMPSAGLTGLLYHMVQIRPALDDDYVIDHLLKLQTIKGSFDESFFLELWLTALTGLREASLNTSCQSLPAPDAAAAAVTAENNKEEVEQAKNCNGLVATNRLLWKSLVLVKLPHLLSKLQAKKQEKDDYILEKPTPEDEFNSFEASLRELKAFSGLINACSPPACCSDFYAPDSMSSVLVDKIAFGQNGNDPDDNDDFINMISDMSNTAAVADLNTPALTKSIRSIGSNDIFTNLVNVCERYGFVRPNMAAELTRKSTMMDTEQAADMMTTPIVAIDQVLHIGLVSPIHLRKIIDFVLDLLKQKSAAHDFFALSKICDALSECPCSVDLILQLYTPADLLGPLESVCTRWNPADYEMETEDNDESTANAEGGQADALDGVQLLYSKFGIIWNFAVSVVKKFKLHRDLSKVFQDKQGSLYTYFDECAVIYGMDVEDESLEPFINRWLSGLAGSDGLSDDLLRTSTPQELLKVVPTIIQRSILLYANQQIERDAFEGMISYFQKRFLNFTLYGVFNYLCQELLSGHSAIALDCLSQLVRSEHSVAARDFNLHAVLGSLESLLELKRQEAAFDAAASTTSSSKQQQESNAKLAQDMSELMQFIHNNSKLTEDHSSVLFLETVTTGVTPWTLFEKAELMFKYIVKSGRSLYMSDVDADTNTLWDDQAPSKMQVVSHYLDMVLFETALEIGGGHWFVGMIVDRVLEAGRSGGAVRAGLNLAELGSCLITTPLLYSANTHNSCVNLLRCLLQDILPSRLYSCAEQNMSYFQGQTLGVFTSDCLVLMQDHYEAVKDLGKCFFETLVIDQHHQKKQRIDHPDDNTSTIFANWGDEVTKSAVWRGFIKGLMSNPMIEETWPNAFV